MRKTNKGMIEIQSNCNLLHLHVVFRCMVLRPETTCNVPIYSPPHPQPLLAPLLRPPLVLVVRHARGIPCHSCHVKECSQKPGDVFFSFFCSKHLNMHSSLPSLNHMVGSETRAHLTRTRTNRSASLRTCADEIRETGAQRLGASSWLAGR